MKNLNPNIIQNFSNNAEELIKSKFSDTQGIISTLESNFEKGFINENEFLSSLNTIELLEKGGKKAIVGEKRMFGGREYIKTPEGWKFHGKGTGVKAKEHSEKHGVKEEKEEVKDAASKHDHSDKKFEDAPEDHEHKVGDVVKIHHDITDPIGKQGETGTLVSVDKNTGDHRVRFSDGQLGEYDKNTLKREKKDESKEDGGSKKDSPKDKEIKSKNDEAPKKKKQTFEEYTKEIEELKKHPMHKMGFGREKVAEYEKEKEKLSQEKKKEEAKKVVEKIEPKKEIKSEAKGEEPKKTEPKKEGKTLSPTELKTKMGLRDGDIVPKGQHTHSHGYEPTFRDDDKGLYISYDTGQTKDWDKGGSYTSNFFQVSNKPNKNGKYVADSCITRSKNNYTNDTLSEKYPIEDEEFDTYEEARKRILDYISR